MKDEYSLKPSLWRAVLNCAGRLRLFLSFAILFFCGLIHLFFNIISLEATGWMKLFLRIFPLFFSMIFLMGGGVVLIRLYHHEIKGIPIDIKRLLWESKERVALCSSYGIPLVLSYLVLSFALGGLLLFHYVPLLGPLLDPLITMGVFIVVFLFFMLSFVTLGLLFYFPPLFALRPLVNKRTLIQSFKEKFMDHPFHQLLMFGVGFLFLGVWLSILGGVFFITQGFIFEKDISFFNAFQTFFILLPFSGLLAPGLSLFFNVAAEAHVLSMNTAESVLSKH